MFCALSFMYVLTTAIPFAKLLNLQCLMHTFIYTNALCSRRMGWMIHSLFEQMLFSMIYLPEIVIKE